MSLATTGINVVAAVLVAMQKFFMLAEKVRPAGGIPPEAGLPSALAPASAFAFT